VTPARFLATAVLGATLLGAAGCAYYNTFYYARSQFRVAYPRRVDAFLATGSPTAQQSAALDSARVRCKRVIVNYPRSKWVDDAYLLAGQTYFGKGKYPEAIQQLTALRDSFPKSELLPEATTFLGAARIKSGDVVQGREDLIAVRSRWPKYEYRDLATYLLAESHRLDFAWSDALPYYEEIAHTYSKSPVYDRAALQAGVCLSKLRRFEEARAYLSRIGERKVAADVQFEALRIQGESYLDERRFADAERVFRRLDDQVAERVQSGQPVQGGAAQLRSAARVRVAQAQNGQGDYEGALRTLQAVVDENPRTGAAAEAQFHIGYTREIHLDDPERAREAYAKVRDHQPGSQFATRAESRSKNLERLRTMRLTGAADPAERAFVAAELTLLDLEKPQEAIAQYDVVRRRYPQSEYAQKASYAIAWSTLNVVQDTARAIELLTNLLRRHPGTVYADDARFLLRRLQVLSPDSTPLVVDWAALLQDSAAVADSLAPFETRADSLARAAADRDTLLAREARARADSIRSAAALQDSIENTRGDIKRAGRERDDRPVVPRRPGGRPSPYRREDAVPPPPVDSTRARDDRDER
jgi:TolA-binding protein